MDIWTQLARFAFVETQRLFLRPFQYADHQQFYDIICHGSHYQFVFPKRMTKDESDFLMVNAFMKEPLGVWLIEDKTSHSMLGSIRLEKYDKQQASAEIGYFLAQPFWGQGLMTEVLKTLTFLAFQEFGLRQLIIVTHLENKASQRVAEKAGFRLTKQFKGSDRHSHHIRDYLEYQLTIGEYHYE
ncbi:GNAT family N-acetyltransferase [Streptococcus equi]|uniref:GNAT family N-acetyltransferase n=1 Tax=Streptococcus equi TaxID=1336 RepID=UPI00197FC740|nr:GNAT family N-acetyltransferase [Streptococcus equi]MCD3455199.1 GNAT family N-acetyltransferase [Streptococcus equi subsp. zooepidemicus]MCD3463278.1 GNAT family N-acetyltransferase [Streptococcus equi subsp. zooepidemicus]MDI5914509.1 GNAT family N-acetyltransferase [Streptococcus equi subsp. zooepidemicus]QTR94184.1 hypothetical protein IEMOCGPF_01275 [Streptococcus equi subsp. zooepidemicus]HEL0551498.1 GNAT family N-acetyltransferase [Streptococcus equi subsp. zooepidemicus]